MVLDEFLARLNKLGVFFIGKREKGLQSRADRGSVGDASRGQLAFHVGVGGEHERATSQCFYDGFIKRAGRGEVDKDTMGMIKRRRFGIGHAIVKRSYRREPERLHGVFQ